MRATLLVLIGLALLFIAACATNPCAGKQDSELSLCVIGQATAAGDATLCDSLDGTQRTWCLTDVANATADPAACARIADVRSADFCRRDLILKQGVHDDCAALTYDEARDGCYAVFADRESDWSLCQNIAAQGHQDLCLDTLSRRAIDPHGCLPIAQGERRDACLFLTSIQASDTESCLAIGNETYVDYCVINIAANQGDLATCDTIPDARGRIICTEIVTKAMQNETVPLTNQTGALVLTN